VTGLPAVTADLPGSGGVVKAAPEDFRVDEIPAYEPSGSGEHLFLLVEKRGRSTRDVVRDLARVLGIPDRDVGVAGLKDRQAVTTQWLSFAVRADPDPGTLAGEGFRVLRASRHGNKLRIGHSRGNRFAIAVRGGDLSRAATARTTSRRISFMPVSTARERSGTAPEVVSCATSA
jgi:tRNA pseudouridine13 synthase